MSQRDATASRSATELGSNDSRAPTTIMQSFKRGRFHLEPPPTAPTILLNDNSSETTSTIQVTDDRMGNASTETVIANYNAASSVTDSTPPTGSNHARYLVSKLDRLHDKKERYQSHRQFLQKCLDNDIIPNGLRLDLEPTIGNHDEDFLKNWYAKLEEYSKNFMKDVLAFCEKTNGDTDASITALNTELHTAVEKEQYDNVQATVIQNNALRSQELQRRKNKKFYALKYKKETPRQTTPRWANEQPREVRAENSREYDDRRDVRRRQTDTTPVQPAPVSRWNPQARSYAAVAEGRYQQPLQGEEGRYQQTQHGAERHYQQPRHGTEGRYRQPQNGPEGRYQQPQQGARRVRSRQDLSRRGSFNNVEDKSAPLHDQISLQRKRSFRREDNNEHRLQSEITVLQSQLNDIRNTDNRTDESGATGHNSVTNNRRDQNQNHQKNANITQNMDMGANKEIIQEAFSFVTDAMATLKKFETKFATMLNTHKIPSDRS